MKRMDLDDLLDKAYAMAQGYLNAFETRPDTHGCQSCKEHAQALIEELDKLKAK